MISEIREEHHHYFWKYEAEITEDSCHQKMLTCCSKHNCEDW